MAKIPLLTEKQGDRKLIAIVFIREFGGADPVGERAGILFLAGGQKVCLAVIGPVGQMGFYIDEVIGGGAGRPLRPGRPNPPAG